MPYFAPAWAYGGPPRVVYELSRELVRRGHTVTVVTTDAQDPIGRCADSHEILEGVEVHRFRNASNYLAWHRQAFLPLGLTSFFRHAPRYDVVHMHVFRTFLNMVARRFVDRWDIPYVLSAHGTLPSAVRLRVFKKLFDSTEGAPLLAGADKMIASSEAEMLDYESARVPPSKVALIYFGLDTSEFENLPSPGGFLRSFGMSHKRLVTYLGRLNFRKGLDQLLIAFRDLVDDDDELLLVVAGPDDGYREHLLKRSEELAISGRVLFPGFLAPMSRLQLLVDSELVVYPAPREPFGLVPFEALLCGKPVVVSKDSGCSELLEEAGAAFTVTPSDVKALRDALIAGLREEDTTRQMVRRGKALIAQRLNWKTVVRSVEQVYETARSARSKNDNRE